MPTDLLKFADTAMYQAKAEGRNTYQLYNEAMDAEARSRATIVAALRKALERGEFRLVYQPRMSLADGASPASRRCCAGTAPSWARSRRRCSSRWPRKAA